MIYNVMLVRPMTKTQKESMLVYTTNIEEKFNSFIVNFTESYENVGVKLETKYVRGKHIETLFVEIM